MFQNITSKKRSVFAEILIAITTPTLILVVVLFASFLIFHNNYKSMVKKSYLVSLEQFCIQQDNAISDISHSVSVMSENSRFFNTVNGSLQNISDITYTQRQLDKIIKNHPLIDSICIVEKTSMRAYTQHNIFPLEEYFNTESKYNNYDLNYWLTYISPFSEKAILSPTQITQNGKVKNVIPVVFTKIGDKHLKNIIIINISINSIVSSSEKYRFSENSIFYVVNRGEKQIFGYDFYDTISEELLEKLSKEQSNSFDYKDTENYFALSYTPKRSALGYTYISMIPYSEISKASSEFVNTLFVIGFIAIVLLTALVLFLSKRTYSPYRKIIKLFNADEKQVILTASTA